MAEYSLIPEKTLQPSAFELMEELHRRGMAVEIHLNGRDREWESIRFAEPGPPEVDCLLSFDKEKGHYLVTVPLDAHSPAAELQVHLVDILLQFLGGQVDNINTRERFTPAEFALKIKRHHNPSAGARELFWIVFSWLVVALALGIYFVVAAHLKQLVMLVLVFSLISASLQTYAHFKN